VEQPAPLTLQPVKVTAPVLPEALEAVALALQVVLVNPHPEVNEIVSPESPLVPKSELLAHAVLAVTPPKSCPQAKATNGSANAQAEAVLF
jgi:hypothetical protein